MIKKLASFLLSFAMVFLFLVNSTANAKAEEAKKGLFAVKIGSAQIFDCYRSGMGDSSIDLHNFSTPYVVPWTNGEKVDFGVNKDRYIQIVKTNTDGIYGLELYESDGTFVQDISLQGVISFLASENPGFLYVGYPEGDNADSYSSTGYYISYRKGYDLGDSETLQHGVAGTDLLLESITGADDILKPGESGCVHEWNEATCTAPKTCKICGATVGAPKGHTASKVNGQAATCTADGWLDYYQCSDCNKYFQDSTCTTEIADLSSWKNGDGKLPAFGHTGVKVNGQAATCTADGWLDYYQCSNCNKYFQDSACTTEIADLSSWKNGDGRLSKTAHSFGPWKVTAEPTQTANGQKQCTCTVCGKIDAAEIPMLPTYHITEGAGSSFVLNSGNTLIFRSDAYFAKFCAIKIDKNPVEKTCYDIDAETAGVKLHTDYLNTLTIGAHTITIVFNDGECGSNFVVQSVSPITPQTGDPVPVFMWILLSMVSLSTMAVIFSKKQTNVK